MLLTPYAGAAILLLVKLTSADAPYALPVLGLNLALGYGTAVLFTDNGSSHVAKIEGSSQYSSAMARLIQYSNETVTLPATTACGKTSSILQQLHPCKWMPNLWFCRSDPDPDLDSDLVAVAGMLHALGVAGDIFTSDVIQKTGISLPFRVPLWPPTNRSAFIDMAAKHAGLKAPTRYHPFAGEAAAKANSVGDCNIGHTCDEYEPTPISLVLAVEYSNGILMTSLMTTEFGEFTEVRTETAFDLGSKSRFQYSDEEHWLAVEAQIRTTMELPASNPLASQGISHLVLYGDSTHDKHFQAVLRDTLAGHTSLVVEPSDTNAIPNPIYSAAEGATAFAWPWTGPDMEEQDSNGYNDYAERLRSERKQSVLSSYVWPEDQG